MNFELTPSRLGCYRRFHPTWEPQHRDLLFQSRGSREAPADVLPELFQEKGYQVEVDSQIEHLAEVDHAARVVRFRRDYRLILSLPGRDRDDVVMMLAVELAHLVLHQGKRPHEDRAFVWALLFLIPFWMVRKTTAGQRRAPHDIDALATMFKVPRALAATAVHLYEITARYPAKRAQAAG